MIYKITNYFQTEGRSGSGTSDNTKQLIAYRICVYIFRVNLYFINKCRIPTLAGKLLERHFQIRITVLNGISQ